MGERNVGENIGGEHNNKVGKNGEQNVGECKSREVNGGEQIIGKQN